MSEAVPRLRMVESFPVEHEGRSCVALRDPGGYTDAVVLLHGALLEIVSLFDGEHTVADIQAATVCSPSNRDTISRSAPWSRTTASV